MFADNHELFAIDPDSMMVREIKAVKVCADGSEKSVPIVKDGILDKATAYLQRDENKDITETLLTMSNIIGMFHTPTAFVLGVSIGRIMALNSIVFKTNEFEITEDELRELAKAKKDQAASSMESLARMLMDMAKKARDNDEESDA